MDDMAIRIYGNRAIKTLPGQDVRPTAARVREALFNIWQGKVMGCNWLDLCAGSGAMGAEALCRGASKVIGIDHSAIACEIIQENWQKVAKPEQHFRILRGDVVKQLSPALSAQVPSACFDLIYFDPPYASDLYQPVLTRLVELKLLSPTTEIAVEHRLTHWLTTAPPELEIIREKRYGSSHLTFFSLSKVFA